MEEGGIQIRQRWPADAGAWASRTAPLSPREPPLPAACCWRPPQEPPLMVRSEERDERGETEGEIENRRERG